MIGEIIKKINNKFENSIILQADGLPKVNAMEVKMYYNLGGYNYFTGKDVERGYYLSVQPMTYSDMVREYVPTDGVYCGVKSTSRFSRKAFQQLCDEYLSKDNHMVRTLICAVVSGYAEKSANIMEGWVDYFEDVYPSLS